MVRSILSQASCHLEQGAERLKSTETISESEDLRTYLQAVSITSVQENLLELLHNFLVFLLEIAHVLKEQHLKADRK